MFEWYLNDVWMLSQWCLHHVWVMSERCLHTVSIIFLGHFDVVVVFVLLCLYLVPVHDAIRFQWFLIFFRHIRNLCTQCLFVIFILGLSSCPYDVSMMFVFILDSMCCYCSHFLCSCHFFSSNGHCQLISDKEYYKWMLVFSFIVCMVSPLPFWAESWVKNHN